jgi:hypothetical protein
MSRATHELRASVDEPGHEVTVTDGRFYSTVRVYRGPFYVGWLPEPERLVCDPFEALVVAQSEVERMRAAVLS